jgi:hypothetical protein
MWLRQRGPLRFSVCSMMSPWLAAIVLACQGAPPPSVPGPEEVVRELHGAIRAGDITRAHRHVAYEHRLEEVLGEVWRSGSAADRQGLVSQVQEMFERTTRRLWTEHVGAESLALNVEGNDPTVVWVEARLEKPDPKSFRWRYRLHRLAAGWKITQREAVVSGVPTDTGEFFRIVMRRLEAKLGHAPDLAELRAGLPEWRDRIRKRVLRVPTRAPGREGRSRRKRGGVKP